MADTSKLSVVSNERLNCLYVEEIINNGPKDGSDMPLTECSVANQTNNRSNQISPFNEPTETGYQEIDSFSELSFKTNDEISLQDLMESEFAARISTVNGDDLKEKPGEISCKNFGGNKSHDSFDDLLKDLECYQDPEKSFSCGEEFINEGGEPEENKTVNISPSNEMVTNLDDFINGPMQGDTAPITDYMDGYCCGQQSDSHQGKIAHPDNLYEMKNPRDVSFLSTFDPFTAIEEDPDSSNTNITNSNLLGSPDEFQFPDSPEKSKSWENADEIGIMDVNAESQNYGNIVVNKSKDMMSEFFSKRISDDDSECFNEHSFAQNDRDQSKFHVAGSSDGIKFIDNLTCDASTFMMPDKMEVEKFFSSEDLLRGSEAKSKKEPDEPEEKILVNGDIEDKEISLSSHSVKSFMDIEKSRNAFQIGENFQEVEDKWTTVEEVLSARTENTISYGDTCLVDVTNECDKKNNNFKSYTNDLTEKMRPNIPADSDSEAETKSESCEKKAIKKKKSKKGKKSEEKENISVMLTYSTEGPRLLQNCWYRRTSETGSVQDLKARSMVDLSSNSVKVAALRSDLFKNSKSLQACRSITNLSAEDRHPVVTGVSVQILKSSFSKFDQLSKKTILHVRSVDASKVQKQFNEATTGISEVTYSCKSCGKQVFQMEQIKAEKSVWHKNCFRCKECNKQLSVDTYSSNEGIIYCKQHFKELFKPKAVLDDDVEPAVFKKPELIIRENQPVELPPEVIRASDKPDLGLDELASLNVKSRYQVFEKAEVKSEQKDKSPVNVNVKRSPSILSKLAKFQKKGLDVGVRDEELNGLPIEQSSTSSEEDEEKKNEGDLSSGKVIKSKRGKERPMSFSKMVDVKTAWESGMTKSREERNAEIHQIRSKLFMGKQVKMKEAYEQAVRDSENKSPRKSIDVRCEKAKSIKECFEKGEPLNLDDDKDMEETKKKSVDDDKTLFEAGISKKSRSLFLELDKSAKAQGISFSKKDPLSKSSNTSSSRAKGVSSNLTENVIKSSDIIEDVQIETADISSKFQFFESYKEPEREKKKFRITPPREDQMKSESPEKEICRDPNVIRANDKTDHEIIRTNTTTKMLSLFRQMEEKTEEVPGGPKPLKCFTPPPDYKRDSESESVETEESEEEESEVEKAINPNVIRASDRVEDEYLKQAANAERAKQLKAKFEKWEEKDKEEDKEENSLKKVNGFASNEGTKSLRARFESMKGSAEQPKEKVARSKINRFVEIQNNMAELCDVCRQRVYQLEKIETSGKIFHKACFRCMQCNCLLRMESFTLNCGNLYCLPHFKQKFISKGNYDEGFGVDQHKAKWPTVTTF